MVGLDYVWWESLFLFLKILVSFSNSIIIYSNNPFCIPFVAKLLESWDEYVIMGLEHTISSHCSQTLKDNVLFRTIENVNAPLWTLTQAMGNLKRLIEL